MHELIDTILKSNLLKLKKGGEEFTTASDPDPEVIHDMRVAIRRLRGVMVHCKKFLPPQVKTINADLQKLFRLLGKKRDLDIFAHFLKQSGAKEVPKLQIKMDVVQKKIRKKLKSRSYKDLLHLVKDLQTLKTIQNHVELGKKKIKKALGAILMQVPHIDPEADDKALHELRIALKKLRYLCELFETLLPLKKLIAETKQLQDILGKHQDVIIGIALLERYQKGVSKKDFLKLQKKYELEKKRMRRLFFKSWKDYCEAIISTKVK